MGSEVKCAECASNTKHEQISGTRSNETKQFYSRSHGKPGLLRKTKNKKVQSDRCTVLHNGFLNMHWNLRLVCGQFTTFTYFEEEQNLRTLKLVKTERLASGFDLFFNYVVSKKSLTLVFAMCVRK